MRCSLLFLCLLLLLGSNGYPWGSEGHKAIAEAAKGLLTPDARARVEKILGHEELAAGSVWLDDVRIAKKRRSGPLKDDPEAADFNRRFPTNDVWHYVDLPVGWTTYSERGFFASKDDIVHAIHHAVDVLEGRASDFTDQEALRVLVHLVGDVHQPLHTAAGYYDVSDPNHPKLVSNPEIAKTKPHDRGGNQLFYAPILQLHALWDDEIPQQLVRAEPGKTLAQQLTAEAIVEKWLTPGDYHQWAEKWVEDSAAQAIEVYRGITFGPAKMRPDGTLDEIEITLPDRYMETQAPRAKSQLAKAATHLAQLLNRIQFR